MASDLEDHRCCDGDGIFQKMGGCGEHEVVIESPDHATFLSQQPHEQVELLLGAIRSRYTDLLRDLRFQSIVIFKNHGPGAGTSLRHPHWQIIALPIVPRLVRQKCAEANEYFDRHGCSLYHRILDEELADGRRIVLSNDEFLAFVPFAGYVPFETWIMPRRQAAAWDSLDDGLIPALAEILQNVLRKIYVGLANPDFNLTVDLAPRGEEDEPSFRWHIRILPRLSTPAGFEMGSGMSINTVLPEDAAAYLRDGAPIETSTPQLVQSSAS